MPQNHLSTMYRNRISEMKKLLEMAFSSLETAKDSVDLPPLNDGYSRIAAARILLSALEDFAPIIDDLSAPSPSTPPPSPPCSLPPCRPLPPSPPTINLCS